MANEIRARFNLVSGTLSGALTNVATSMSSAGLANLGVIDSTNHAAITIENEIVWVTAHTGGATTATILRGQEGTSAAAHSSAVAWQHGPTALDLGIRFWNPPACRVYHNTTQTATSAATTYLAFNSERFNTDAMHDTVTNNSRITIKTAGLYVVGGHIQCPGATGRHAIIIDLNGATQLYQQEWQVNASSDTYMAAGTIWKFAVNDYVRIGVYQASGSNQTIPASTGWQADFWATWIGLG